MHGNTKKGHTHKTSILWTPQWSSTCWCQAHFKSWYRHGIGMSPFKYTSTEGLSLQLCSAQVWFLSSLMPLWCQHLLTSPVKQWNALFSQKAHFGAISLGSTGTFHLTLRSWQVERCDYWKTVVHFTMLALNTATLKHLVPPTIRNIQFLPVHRKFCTHLPNEALVLCCAGDSSAPYRHSMTAIVSCFHSFWSSIILTVILTLMILTTSLIQINATLLHLFPSHCLKPRGFVSLEQEHSQIQLQCLHLFF